MLHCKNTYKLIRTRVLKKTKFHASPSRGEAERSSDEGENKNFITLTCHKVTSSPLKGEVYFSHLLRNFNQQIFSSRIEFFIQNVIIKICNILYKMLHLFLPFKIFVVFEIWLYVTNCNIFLLKIKVFIKYALDLA